MILDYNYSKSKRNLSVSYITNNGGKKILNFNVDKFKSYYSTPLGKYNNWDGSKCDIKWVDKPSNFDIKTFMNEMDPRYKNMLDMKCSPKLYTFDIETEISDEFPEPTEAKFPITTISIASPDCNVVILGTKELDDDCNLTNRFQEYLQNSKYFKSLNMNMPYIKYIKFDTEESMLKYFLMNIVAKVPILAGWNSILFDWQYIQNRIINYFPNLTINSASMNWTTSQKNYTDMKGNKVRLNMPNHTLILDMMDVIGSFDMVVMPIKESLSLDYIASESIGIGKIKYDGDLQKLYEEDYSTYVFYNAIDSILVQLIDKRFKTLQNIYAQSLYCKEKIGSCFSKIALTEALFFNYFYEHDIKIVPIERFDVERGILVGAYVATPVPGRHSWVTCNDFASLYPNCIRSLNISIENFVGTFYNEIELQKYREDKSSYVIVGGSVYKNNGTANKPSLGELIKHCLLEDELDVYRKDPNYFVSVNGHVYKNDKDYSFRNIQTELYNNRNASKYLSKQLDAFVMSDIEHIKSKTNINDNIYNENIINKLKELGWDIVRSSDILRLDKNKLIELESQLKNEITYLTSFEQACKLLMNSMYGGSSHVAFAFFNICLANDITGEAKNLIHLMEDHIPNWFENNWRSSKDLHKRLGIVVKDKINKGLVTPVAGDTDSIYLSYNELLNSIEGIEQWSIEKKTDFIARLNTEFLDGHNNEFMREYYKTRHVQSTHAFELETIALRECRLDVKKRYAQLLLWKDGKIYDVNNLPLKVKGLEMVKSSYPKQAREGLKRMVRYLLEDDGEGFFIQRLNIKMQEEKRLFFNVDIEDICGNVGVQNYTKYILDDNNKNGLVIAQKCPYNVRALGNYNRLRNIYNLPGDPLYGGKMKWYCYYEGGNKNHKKQEPDYFAFQSRNYPKWANQYAPICKETMFEKMMLDPFNRIIEAVGLGKLNPDGAIQINLFD